jgi:PAS domain S-box-containing protein
LRIRDFVFDAIVIDVENTVRILLAEQEREILSLLTLSLSGIKECELEICTEPADLLRRLTESEHGLVLLNAGNEPAQALSTLNQIHLNDAGIYVIVSLREQFENLTDRFMMAGAHDCVVKDRNYVPNIVSAVKKALIRIAEREAFEIPVLARAQRFAMDENLPDIIFSLDLEGQILYANQAISLLGYEQNEIVGAEFSNLIATEASRNAFEAYLKAVDQEISFREMVQLLGRDGQKNFDINFTLMEGEIIYGVARKEAPASIDESDEESGPAAESPVSEPGHPEAIPARLGPYRIVTLLGAGAMGRVYKGFDEHLERNVAIKVISRALTENEQYVERFRREAKILASISHPNIALVYYFGSLDGLPYFCMEYLPNGSLENQLEKQQVIDPQMTISYIIQVASGLREALSKGVLHMDIKPSNLMLAEDGRLKIVDFGLAQTKRDRDDLEKNIVGTPIYIAPEQIMGGVADFRMDIYSLGITFFEMLYGSPPFKGNSVPDIFHAKLKGAIPARSELNPAVPAKFYELITRMIERDPLQRIGNYSELIEDLEAARRSSVTVDPVVEIPLPDKSAITMRGLIYDHPFPEVLGHIAQHQLSGKLTISWGQLLKQIHFRKGKLIAMFSNQEGENFIDLVISRLPAEAKLMRKIQTNQSSDLYQGYSTAMEKISPEFREGFSDDLRLHALKIVESLFAWLMGEFIFETGEFPGQLDLEISMHDTVTNGVRRWLDYEVIRRRLFEGACLIRHDPDFIRYLRDLDLEPSDRFLLFRFENEIEYRKLFEISGISEEEFGRLIYLFNCFGLIHIVHTGFAMQQQESAPFLKEALDRAGGGLVAPEAQTRSTGDLGTYYTHCAVKSFEQKNYWACVEYCRKAVEHRQDPNVYRLMGRALATHVRLRNDALDAYTKALALAPNDAGIERDMADLYFDAGNLVLAKNKYEGVVRQNPGDQHSIKRLQEISRRKR